MLYEAYFFEKFTFNFFLLIKEMFQHINKLNMIGVKKNLLFYNFLEKRLTDTFYINNSHLLFSLLFRN